VIIAFHKNGLVYCGLGFGLELCGLVKANGK